MDERVRVLILDEQSVARESLRRLLESQPDFEVLGVAGRSGEAVRRVAETHPDVVLLAAGPGAEPLLATLRGIQAVAPAVGVLVIGEVPVHVSAVLLAGARGVLRGEAGSDELFKAIRTVKAGEYWVARGSLPEVIQHLRVQGAAGRAGARGDDGLTTRQRQIAAGVGRGESNRELAQRLGLTEGTVKGHLTAIFGRLRLSNRAELAAWATRRGLVDGDPPADTGHSGSALG